MLRLLRFCYRDRSRRILVARASAPGSIEHSRRIRDPPFRRPLTLLIGVRQGESESALELRHIRTIAIPGLITAVMFEL